MDLDLLYKILNETTCQLRKGPMVEKTKEGSLETTHVYFMPDEKEAPENITKVDMHFIIVGVDKEKAEKRKDDLVNLLQDYPDMEAFKGESSYIPVGANIGDQGAAFQLFALGEVLDLWGVITPERMGFKGEMGDMLASRGMITMTGFKPPSLDKSVPLGM